MVQGVQERLEEQSFVRRHPELSVEAALIIWILAGYASSQTDEPKPH